jgi:acetyl esterase/lipase
VSGSGATATAVSAVLAWAPHSPKPAVAVHLNHQVKADRASRIGGRPAEGFAATSLSTWLHVPINGAIANATLSERGTISLQVLESKARKCHGA